MKLIDLLVQEFPKRGGWPEGADYVVQDSDGSLDVKFGAGEATLEHDQRGVWVNNITPDWGIDTHESYIRDFKILACDASTAIITREQYESALAESRKPSWNGEGVPPVGCKCECQFLDAWHVCKVLFVGAEVIVSVIDGSERAFSVNHTKFRPLQSEAERKRDAAVEAMQREADEGDNWIYSEYEIIYDAIAAGKIPGVKLGD